MGHVSEGVHSLQWTAHVYRGSTGVSSSSLVSLSLVDVMKPGLYGFVVGH
jgi:hypothetical protein